MENIERGAGDFRPNTVTWKNQDLHSSTCKCVATARTLGPPPATWMEICWFIGFGFSLISEKTLRVVDEVAPGPLGV